jgi:hypothetical protein
MFGNGNAGCRRGAMDGERIGRSADYVHAEIAPEAFSRHQVLFPSEGMPTPQLFGMAEGESVVALQGQPTLWVGLN